jgi:hypothetical protein
MTTSLGVLPPSALTSVADSSVVGAHTLGATCCTPQGEHDQCDWACNEQNFIPTTLVSKHPRIVEASA